MAKNVKAVAAVGTFPANPDGTKNYNEVASLTFDCSAANQSLCGVCFASYIQTGPLGGPYNTFYAFTSGSTGATRYSTCGSVNNTWSLTLNFGPLAKGTVYYVQRCALATPATGCGGLTRADYGPPYISELIAL